MYKYHFVAVGVAPKREKLRLAMEELDHTERILSQAKNKLSEVEAGVLRLQRRYSDSMNKRQMLEEKCKLCQARLDRADKVMIIMMMMMIMIIITIKKIKKKKKKKKKR